jgi:DNA-binding CsgD family transcriptional regulator
MLAIRPRPPCGRTPEAPASAHLPDGRTPEPPGSARAAPETAAPAGVAGLTDREVQVLDLAAQGRTNTAIARIIDVSPRTIAKHLEHIYRKLGVTSRAAAVYRTARAGISEELPGPGYDTAAELDLTGRPETLTASPRSGAQWHRGARHRPAGAAGVPVQAYA